VVQGSGAPRSWPRTEPWANSSNWGAGRAKRGHWHGLSANLCAGALQHAATEPEIQGSTIITTPGGTGSTIITGKSIITPINGDRKKGAAILAVHRHQSTWAEHGGHRGGRRRGPVTRSSIMCSTRSRHAPPRRSAGKHAAPPRLSLCSTFQGDDYRTTKKRAALCMRPFPARKVFCARPPIRRYQRGGMVACRGT